MQEPGNSSTGEDNWLEEPTIARAVQQRTGRRVKKKGGRRLMRQPEDAEDDAVDVVEEAVKTWSQYKWNPRKTERKMTCLQWWKAHEHLHPIVAGVARRCLALQASSAASERSFSKSGLIVSKKRQCLKAQRVDGLTLVGWHYDELNSRVPDGGRGKKRRVV